MLRNPDINSEGVPIIATIGQVVPTKDIPYMHVVAEILNRECAIPEIDYVPTMYAVDLHTGAYDVDFRGRRLPESLRRVVLGGDWLRYNPRAGYTAYVDRFEALRQEYEQVDEYIDSLGRNYY